MAVLSAPPLKRLSRPQSGALPPLRIGSQHIAMVQAVAQARFLSSEQITRKVGGSHQKNLRRLQKLWAHGFLDRPMQQHAELAAFFDQGNRPLVYALGRRGARLLADHGMAIDHKLDWTTKNVRATAPFLAHTIDTAECMLAFEFDVRARPGLRLFDHHELLQLMPEATREARDPFALRVTVNHEQRNLAIAVVPDRLFSIASQGANTRQNFALERDRGTMVIGTKETKLTKSSYRRKLIAYADAFQKKKHTQVWGFQSFRVLTVTTSEVRITNMIAAQCEATNAPAGLFLYSTPERIAEHGALGPAWTSAKADRISLVSDHTIEERERERGHR